MTLDEIIHDLRHIRTHYGSPHGATRRRLLRAASACAIEQARQLIDYHELLLFAVAFPDDVAVRKLADAELARVARAARALVRRGRRRDLHLLTDSGIAHTENLCQLSAQTSHWLARRFPRDSEIAWGDESGGAGLDAMLATITEPVEMDGVGETAHSTQQWFALARGRRARGSDLSWLLQHFAALDLSAAIRDKIFDLFELQIRWRLASPIASRTFARLPRGALHVQRQALQRGADLEAILKQALPAVKPEPIASAERFIDRARAALAARHRETDPVTFAERRDVSVFDLGRGITIVLFGKTAAQRLPLNAYYGFVLAKNRVPIAYGGGWMFFDRCEIGINVFETFRGGESAYTFAQLLRLYHHHFKVRRFTVEPYQFGAGNPEAIRSGAPWFYYRFGFRPLDPAARALAEREWQRLHSDPAYRTSASTLRRLTGSFLALDVGPHATLASYEPGELSLAITRWIGVKFAGERDAARAWAKAQVRSALGVGDDSGWPLAERRAFDDFSLLIAPIADLATWTAGEKTALIALMRAKGGLREREFALRLGRHRRLHAAWGALLKVPTALDQ